MPHHQNSPGILSLDNNYWPVVLFLPRWGIKILVRAGRNTLEEKYCLCFEEGDFGLAVVC
jgi:hypothetical protein